MFITRSQLTLKYLKPSIKVAQTYGTETQLLKTHFNDKLVLTINRPKVHNTINVKISMELNQELKNMEKYSLVILKGAGDKAFSAGGDILEMEKSGRNGTDTVYKFSASLNENICSMYNSKIPVITVANGLLFGGSVGYAVFAKYAVVTEKTVFCMPEARIGLYPNSGGTYFLSKLKGNLGYYLGLTGRTIKGSDVLKAGVATHFCYSKNLKKLEERLLQCSKQSDIEDILKDNCETELPEFSLLPVEDNIKRCFSEPTIEQIVLKLKEDGSSWAENTLNMLAKCSPTSLKVVLKQLQAATNMELQHCLLMETHAVIAFCKHSDMYEGIRITLRARDQSPNWNPPTLEEVTEEMVDNHLKPVYKSFEHMIAEILNNKPITQ